MDQQAGRRARIHSIRLWCTAQLRHVRDIRQDGYHRQGERQRRLLSARHQRRNEQCLRRATRAIAERNLEVGRRRHLDVGAAERHRLPGGHDPDQQELRSRKGHLRMTQTYRTNDVARWGTGQGFNLTAAQVDINFWDLVQRMLAQEARPDAAAGIDHFEIVGINMFVHMTDATVLGPYELPVATFNDRGEWAPETDYSKMDTFSINGGLYVVIWDHTSELTFDAGANDGAGHDYYQLMIQTPGSAMPAGGAVGMLLKKTTTT